MIDRMFGMNNFNQQLTTSFNALSAKIVLVGTLILAATVAHAQSTSFDSCVKGLRQSVVSQGISAEVFDRATAGI